MSGCWRRGSAKDCRARESAGHAVQGAGASPAARQVLRGVGQRGPHLGAVLPSSGTCLWTVLYIEASTSSADKIAFRKVLIVFPSLNKVH